MQSGWSCPEHYLARARFNSLRTHNWLLFVRLASDTIKPLPGKIASQAIAAAGFDVCTKLSGVAGIIERPGLQTQKCPASLDLARLNTRLQFRQDRILRLQRLPARHGIVGETIGSDVHTMLQARRVNHIRRRCCGYGGGGHSGRVGPVTTRRQRRGQGHEFRSDLFDLLRIKAGQMRQFARGGVSEPGIGRRCNRHINRLGFGRRQGGAARKREKKQSKSSACHGNSC